MIIFFAEGQLGNQIFQYAFIKTIQQNNEKMIVSGFNHMLEVFELQDRTMGHFSLKSKWLKRLLHYLIKPMFYKISNIKIINSIEVKHEQVLKNYRRETVEYLKTNGLLKKITFVKLGYFQSEKFFNKKVIQNLQIKDAFLQTANEFLKPYKEKYKVFVHIRRGDYKNFLVYGKESMLPMSYFHTQIKWFLENKKDVYFIFLSDELHFIEDEFDYLNNKIVSDYRYEVDFAIMTLCNSAILSPSSFGWWGGYLMKKRDIVFSPKYWLGFNSRTEYHKEVSPHFVSEIEV